MSPIPSTTDSTVLTASRTTRAHVSTPLHRTSFYHALSPLNPNADIPERNHYHVRETGGASRLWMSAGGDDVGSMISRWNKVAAATAVGLAIFGGGVLMPTPSDVATAGIAPSLMQDEKGYISIFEKVRGNNGVVCVLPVLRLYSTGSSTLMYIHCQPAVVASVAGEEGRGSFEALIILQSVVQ